MDDRRSRFEAQVLPHLDTAYRFARWLARSASDADDVVQEAMLRAYRGFDAFRGSDAKAWLLAIVRNCHATALTQRLRRPLDPLPESDDPRGAETLIATAAGPEDAAIQSDDVRTLERLLAGLSDEHREVLVLREIEDLDYRDIAAVTNLPIGTVMSRLARARSALKAQWSRGSRGESRALP